MERFRRSLGIRRAYPPTSSPPVSRGATQSTGGSKDPSEPPYPSPVTPRAGARTRRAVGTFEWAGVADLGMRACGRVQGMLLEYVHALCVSLSGAGFNVARPAGYAAEAGDYETPQAASAARQARPGGCGQSWSRADPPLRNRVCSHRVHRIVLRIAHNHKAPALQHALVHCLPKESARLVLRTSQVCRGAGCW